MARKVENELTETCEMEWVCSNKTDVSSAKMKEQPGNERGGGCMRAAISIKNVGRISSGRRGAIKKLTTR